MIIRAILSLQRFLDKCKKDNISAFAAQSALFIIVSFIPFLMVFSSLLQYTVVSQEDLMDVIRHIMPEYIAPFVISIVDEVYNKSIGIVSVTAVIAIWSAAKGVQYMAAGMNVINGICETRNWIILRFWAAVYTVVLMFTILAALVLLVFGNSIQEFLVVNIPFLAQTLQIFFRLKSVIVLGVMTVAFAVLFRTLPNGKGLGEKRITFQNQLPGAVICAFAWYLFSFGLSVYVDYFNGFSMYGSLTTIVLVILWMYFCMYIMMFCAELNVMFGEKIQHRVRKKIARKP